MGFGFGFSLLAASLVIVTGPTVIAPLLKRIRVQPKLHSILHWEGVLIDPIGVFIADGIEDRALIGEKGSNSADHEILEIPGGDTPTR